MADVGPSGGRERGGSPGLHRHPAAPPAVRWIVGTLEDAGFETWAVGGAVRDVLLGTTSVDWDFATRARPDEVRRAFRRTVPIGVEHGTVGVLARDGTMYEVTTFRRDVETFGRHAVVEFADRLDDDLSRRDFTINAVAWHPLRDELHDPHGGIEDLDRGVLRTVGDPEARFAEDYLRVLRALRFAGRFRLTVEPATWTALVSAVDSLGTLSVERLREELVKVLEKDPHPSGALGLYAASGALARVHPELEAMVGATPGGSRADRAPDALDAWGLACLSADALPAHRPVLRLAALLLDAGVPDGGPSGAVTGVGPTTEDRVTEERGGRRAAALMSRLRFSNADTDRVVGLVRGGARPPADSATGADLRRWLARTGPGRLPDLIRLWAARARVRDRVARRRFPEEAGRQPGGETRRVTRAARRLRAELAAGPPLSVGDLALGGRDLIAMGLQPGPRFGEILDVLLERVLSDPALNDRDRLAAVVRREIQDDVGAGETGEGRSAGAGGPDVPDGAPGPGGRP